MAAPPHFPWLVPDPELPVENRESYRQFLTELLADPGLSDRRGIERNFQAHFPGLPFPGIWRAEKEGRP